jgi:hypothetical protein
MMAGWSVQVWVAVEADSERDAEPPGQQVLDELDVPVVGTPTVSYLRPGFWRVSADLDISGVPQFAPDDAGTRVRYVKRNLESVTWRINHTGDRHETDEWPPSFWAQTAEEVLRRHPSVRAVLISARQP